MHLADFDPALVTNQVWTDLRQIEERLAELEAHMETVTQKYLRNEYATIESYNAVAGEVALRQQPDSGDGPELFLFIHDLARFRDLRRREDDFGFGRKNEDAAPPDHLDMILREGPSLGVHLIGWCDTVNNLNRYFTHQQLREFEMRVLFQMSPTDSGGLLDSPAASKLGRNRALFASEEQNRLEKFRPYGLPDEEWLQQVGDELSKRPPPRVGTRRR